MLISPLRPDVTLFVTGILAGLAATGCSKDAERPPTLETASSPAPRAQDSAAPRINSASITSTKSTDTPAKPAPKGRPAKPQRATRADTAAIITETSAQVATASPDKWLKYDPATNTVTFELIAGPFNFNGYRNGEATLVLPPKANVVINFVNKDGTPHSAIVISGEGPVPNSATDPAIPRAYTNKVLEGLPQEASDAMRFPVPESGTYRILCGVPGHGPAGMWIWMKVDPSAKTPSFGPTKA
jgi:sulfocyanin